jgi:diacylglycerol kinase family enzyme
MSHPKAEENHEKRRRKGNAVEAALRDMQRAAKRAEAVELTAMLDGKDISGRYLMLEALNLQYVGPNMRLAVETRPGDGHFEVVFVTEAERERLVHYLERWQEDRERLAVLPSHRGKQLLIEWNGLPLHIDDKLHPGEDPQADETAGMVEVAVDGNSSVEVVMPQFDSA